MKSHVWEDIGEAESRGGGRYWTCLRCGAVETSFDKPWSEDGVSRVYITAIECGGGPANVDTMADCDAESVRRIMTS